MAEPTEAKNPTPKAPTLVDAIFSVLASFFGVQSDKNRERDFGSGKPWVFIGVAIVLTVLFVLGLIAVVKIMLHNAGM
jgi:hypothetical protein